MGEGIIRVSKSAFGEQPLPVTLQDWHKRLLLPSDYRVVDLAGEDNQQGEIYLYRVHVVSDAIRNDVSILPDITPFYSRSGYSNKVTLDRIEIRYIEEDSII